MNAQRTIIDDTDRRIIAATQEGLPLVPHPYVHIAVALNLSEEDVRSRMTRMLEVGIIRRIGAVPNHYALGLSANGMTVWDVDDSVAEALGEKIGALDFVSHCYLRPRALPLWPFNLFAMVHGKSKPEVEEKAAKIAELLGADARAHDILYSTSVLKKTGLRIIAEKDDKDVPA
ncbi:MAG: siroheme decarboxylase subunit beta [Hyphomicrobiales bacterium]